MLYKVGERYRRKDKDIILEILEVRRERYGVRYPENQEEKDKPYSLSHSYVHEAYPILVRDPLDDWFETVC